jgi:inosine-uridine nucleoside N-ribohydrolase
MGNDIDDALALDMLYKYQDAGDIELLGIMTNKNSEYSAAFIDQMNCWYGYPEIPIGIVVNGADGEHDAVNYTKLVALMKDEQGAALFSQSEVYPHSLMDAHTLYRKLLAEQPDHSVTVVSVGFSTNLARLLESQPDKYSPLTGKELVSKKVKLLSMMAGCFNKEDQLEYNVVKDIPAAKKVIEEWPTTLVASPFEVGIQINYPGQSIEQDFKWASPQPMVEAYKKYVEMPYDRPTWDLTSVLYAVEGSSFFDRSEAGKIRINEKGSTSFVADKQGDRYYLSVDSLQAEMIRHHFIKIITRPPAHFQK